MILFIIAVVSLIAGILLIQNWEFENLGVIFITLGAAGILFVTIFFICLQTEGKSCCVSYKVDRVKYEAAVNNPHLSGMERASAIDMITNDNTIILNNRMWRNNPFVGCFNYYPIGDLELFDIEKLPIAEK